MKAGGAGNATRRAGKVRGVRDKGSFSIVRSWAKEMEEEKRKEEEKAK